MLVYSKVNAIIPSDDGREKVRVNRGEVAAVPEWCAATTYFKLLAADGKLVITSKATADQDVQQAEDKKPENPEQPDNPEKPDKPENPEKPGKGGKK